jgi:hypothetical protein
MWDQMKKANLITQGQLTLARDQVEMTRQQLQDSEEQTRARLSIGDITTTLTTNGQTVVATISYTIKNFGGTEALEINTETHNGWDIKLDYLFSTVRTNKFLWSGLDCVLEYHGPKMPYEASPLKTGRTLPHDSQLQQSVQRNLPLKGVDRYDERLFGADWVYISIGYRDIFNHARSVPKFLIFQPKYWEYREAVQ